MPPYVGQLGALGIAKESVLGTFVNPTEFLPAHLPMGIGSPDIDLLMSKGVRNVPDLVYKAAQGARQGKSEKFTIEVEPENIGNVLMGAFGTDTAAETASFTIGNTNKYINFKEDGGTERTATIALATYIMGTTSATASTLCAAIKTAMEAAAGAAGTYTVSYSYSTKKVTIAVSGGASAVQLLWSTGANAANSARTILGWTSADTSSAASQVSDSTTSTAPWTHAFTRLAAAQLPTYSLWANQGVDYPTFAGAMVNKLDFDIKAPEFVQAEVDYVASKWNGVDSAKTEAYSTLNPFKFDQAVVTVAGSPVTIYKDLKISIDNKVKADPVIGGSIDANVIYSEALEVKFGATIVVEDTTEWSKFVAGTATSFAIALTSTQLINATGSVYYGLSFSLPNLYYLTAPRPLANGLLEIQFQAQGVYDTSTSKTISASLTNSVAAAY